jgi:hypothetical protein
LPIVTSRPPGFSGDYIAAPLRAEGAQRHQAADPVEHDIHPTVGQLTHSSKEVLVLIVHKHRP